MLSFRLLISVDYLHFEWWFSRFPRYHLVLFYRLNRLVFLIDAKKFQINYSNPISIESITWTRRWASKRKLKSPKIINGTALPVWSVGKLIQIEIFKKNPNRFHWSTFLMCISTHFDGIYCRLMDFVRLLEDLMRHGRGVHLTNQMC